MLKFFLVLIGIALMASGALLEVFFVFQALVSGVGMIEKLKDTTWLRCGPMVFFTGLTLVWFVMLGKRWWASMLAGGSMAFGLAWTVFNFFYDKQ